jgi:hypothetical protein
MEQEQDKWDQSLLYNKYYDHDEYEAFLSAPKDTGGTVAAPKTTPEGAVGSTQENSDNVWGVVPSNVFNDMPGFEAPYSILHGIVRMGAAVAQKVTQDAKSLMDTAATGPRPTEDDPSGQGVLAGFAFENAMTFGALGLPMAKQGAAGIFGGRLSKTAPTEDMMLAGEMYKRGMHPDQIHAVTGIDIVPDLKYRKEMKIGNGKVDTEAVPDKMGHRFRYEIDDSNVAFKDSVLHRGNSASDHYAQWSGKLKKVLDHPELFKAYPELGDQRVVIDIHPKSRGGGSNSYPTTAIDPKIEVTAANKSAALDTLLHELQHSVDHIEKMQSGGNPFALPSVKDYYKQAGEVAARNTERRRFYSEKERRMIPPWITEDVPRSDWLWGTVSGFDNPWNLRPREDLPDFKKMSERLQKPE